MEKTTDIISLGAGVQSSALLMMADRGLIKIDGEVVIPKYAIISDTGNEPRKVYDWIEFLKTQVKNIEIVFTDNGHIVHDTLKGVKNGDRFASVPFFTKERIPVYKQIPIGTETIYYDENGEECEKEYAVKEKLKTLYRQGEQLGYKESKGMLFRQCTSEYKIVAVRRKIRELLGYGRRERVKEKVRLWMGISTDEIHRAKNSQVGYIDNVFPLVDNNMSRTDCFNWFKENGLPLPPKSACIICPYRSNDGWREMKENDPESWEMAVDFDKKIRNLPNLKHGETFIHRSCKPLEEADLGAEQLDLFGEECEGMCGL